VNAEQGGDAFAEFRAKWLADEPEARLATLFHPALREPRAEALHVLRHELSDAAFVVRDADVAQAKLGWWLGETDALAAGRPQHPITRRLAACAAALDAGAFARVVAGAGAVARIESPEHVDALLSTVRRMSDAWGRLAGAQDDAALDAARAAAVVAGALARWPRFAAVERARVPLELLARHGVNRAELLEPAHGRAAQSLLRELLGALDARLAAAPRSVAALDAAWLAARRVLIAHLLRDVAAVQAGRPRPLGLRALFATWSDGRRLRAT
jgi:phytoene synthase